MSTTPSHQKEEAKPLAITLHPIKSSQLKEAGYSTEHKTVQIRFRDGGPLYEYPHITPEDWAAFQAAESQGSYFIRNWKNRTFKKFPNAAT